MNSGFVLVLLIHVGLVVAILCLFTFNYTECLHRVFIVLSLFHLDGVHADLFEPDR